MTLVKTPEQVDKMRVSAALLARCLDMLVACAKPGHSAKELDAIAEEFMRDHNAIPAFKGYGSDPEYPASICFSKNEVLVHGIPTEDLVVEEGYIITIDSGLSLGGWFADAARLLVIGELSAEDQNLVLWAHRALDAGIDACVAGSNVGDISYAIQVEIGRSPFYNIVQFCGHAIGQELHESPQIPNFGLRGKGEDLVPGVVVCLEPMLKKTNSELEFLSDSWTVVPRDRTRTVHMEQMILITEDKPEILTA